MLWDLAVTPFAEILRKLSSERRSGDLQVRSGKIAKTAFFDHGRAVFAASNLKKDRLGEALVALGRITDEEFNRASALMREGDRKRRFGEALIQSGVLDKNELGGSVARQVKRIVHSLFDISEGAASFEERKCVIPLDYMVSLSVHRLLYDGIRSMKSRELIISGIGDLDRWFTLASVPPFPFNPRECSAEEKEMLEQCRRRVTLRRLAWSHGGLAFSRLRAAYALSASGVLHDATVEEGQEGPQPIVQMETGTFLLSALTRKPDASGSGSQAIRKEVEDELDRSSRLDRESWLKVAASAPREELIKALEEKMERYHALREAVGDDDGLKTDIDVILGRASAMLRLTRQSLGAPATAPAAARAAAAPRVAPPAAPPVRKPLPTTGRPVEVGAVVRPVSALHPEPKTQPLDAHIAATAQSTAPEASAPEPSVPEPSAPPPPANPTPTPMMDSGSAAPPGSSNFAGKAQVEHLLMEAEVRMTVSDYANAVKVYTKLVSIAPLVAAYRAKLALAMACYPRTAKQAEREFHEAVRLGPNDPDIHYQFGLYYKAMKQRSRAVAEMRTAVRLNPRHRLAREELETLSPKDSALTSLKKLFK
jgi:tetratricopeptide (TPR) repeat protein